MPGRRRRALRLKRRQSQLLLTILGVAAALAGCRQELPDAQSYGARLYAARCGGCHAAYAPASLTASMWQVQVDAMEARMRQAAMPALTDAQRRALLDYLQQHAQR